jgi:hypothetical protein
MRRCYHSDVQTAQNGRYKEGLKLNRKQKESIRTRVTTIESLELVNRSILLETGT